MRGAHHCSGSPISEMTYTVLSVTLNSTIPYHTIPYHTITVNPGQFIDRLIIFCSRVWFMMAYACFLIETGIILILMIFRLQQRVCIDLSVFQL